MSFTSEQMFTLIWIPLVVSIAANLLSPIFWRSAIRGMTGIAKSLNILGTKGVKLRLNQLVIERKNFEEISKSPYKLILHLGGRFSWQLLMIWLLVITICIFILYGNSPSLNEKIKFVIPSVFGAGGIQAFVGCLTTWGLIDRLNDAESYLIKLNQQILELESILFKES